MASGKKRRKAARAAKKKPTPAGGPFRHPDGDRRHRDMGQLVKDAIKQKELLRQIGTVELAEEDEGDG